jgi:hypothetical protein
VKHFELLLQVTSARASDVDPRAMSVVAIAILGVFFIVGISVPFERKRRVA